VVVPRKMGEDVVFVEEAMVEVVAEDAVAVEVLEVVEGAVLLKTRLLRELENRRPGPVITAQRNGVADVGTGPGATLPMSPKITPISARKTMEMLLRR
jgi:ribose 5-phosphate isomerase